MCGDLGVGKFGISPGQVADRFGIVTLVVQHPAHAVENGRLTGRQPQGFLDQYARFIKTLGAVGQRVAQGIERCRVVGVALQD